MDGKSPAGTAAEMLHLPETFAFCRKKQFLLDSFHFHGIMLLNQNSLNTKLF